MTDDTDDAVQAFLATPSGKQVARLKRLAELRPVAVTAIMSGRMTVAETARAVGTTRATVLQWLRKKHPDLKSATIPRRKYLAEFWEGQVAAHDAKRKRT